MAVIYEVKERRVIPNWRDFRRTLQIGELNNSNQIITPLELNIDRSLNDWKETKNIGTAADLVNSAFVSGHSNCAEVDEAITFINEHKDQSSTSLQSLIKLLPSKEDTLNKAPTSVLELDVDTIEEFQAFIDNNVLNRIIGKTKRKARLEPKNAINWIDLARLYSMHGQMNQANQAIQIALQLAPNNRFVLRSATRFYIHTEQFEKALFYLRKSDRTKKDPWLISAHIATSSIMERFSPLIKDGKSLLESRSFSTFETTELASSLGTLEFKDGSFNKAKRYFEHSLITPNDNSLAQIEWISKDDYRFQINPLDFGNVVNPFEALAQDLFAKGDWQGSFNNCIKWFLDMPYSKRPALLGSYIVGSLLKDENAATLLTKHGLKANPFDPSLLNNITYSYATLGNLEESVKYASMLQKIDLNTIPDTTKITIQATLGLVELKNGDIENGIKLYELSISNAKRIRNKYLEAMATLNFTRELVKKQLPSMDEYIEKCRNLNISDKNKDLKLLADEVFKEIEKTQHNK